ncbi:serine hydrolase domain-containing protein [Erythrobacter sp. F6033]|uniref:serine hydrolase domain-containing protein n=1 Tax=Erythrobacter sp. F6033 TaxID=2926401 RepID=UPI001FF23253|nr:serine hydrolase domain-containing protein [Erythrobacter sp. F6033]MCK0128507.1 beta-lactamase family protein [Erythrobacter sp. F6033]
MTKKRIGIGIILAIVLGAGAFIIAGILEPSLDPDFERNLTAASPTETQQLIAEEAEKLGVTALSVTVIDGDSDPQNLYFGRAHEGGVMQVASLSKAVASTVILMVAEARSVGIDDDIRDQIRSLDIASLEGGDRPITLRQLLSHTTGASQSGYPGYPRYGEVPDTVDVINAPPRLIESQLTFDGEPGKFRYSGGGYTIAQLWAEEVTGKPFEAIAEEVLLAPLGMNQSTFTQPVERDGIAPLEIVGADAGFDPFGGVFSSLDDDWHIYPEKAAAGLWTTSQDYARFVAAVMDAAAGAENTIPTQIASEMIKPFAKTGWGPDSYYGLGVMVTTAGDSGILEVSHTGANAGYRSLFVVQPATDDTERRVVVVSANTASAQYLNKAIGDALIAR